MSLHMLSRSKIKIALKPFAAFLLPWFDRLVLVGQRARPMPDRVLVVRPDAIGDFVLWLDAARQLTDHYRSQGRHITLLANAAWAPWAQSLGLADTVWPLQPSTFIKNLRYRARWIRQVHAAGFGTVIHPTFSREMVTGDAIVRASAATHRIGSVGDTTNVGPRLKRVADRWYTQLVPAAPGQRMELQRHAEFLGGLTGHPRPARMPLLVDRGAAPLQRPSTPYAVLFPAASWAGRMWPAERFVELARRLRARGLAVVVAGGPHDGPFADPIVYALPGQVSNMVGQTSLQDLAEVLRHARLVVTNETSTVHIAAAVRAPTLCILGGGHFGRFVPYDLGPGVPIDRAPVAAFTAMSCYGCNWTCIHSRPAGRPVLCIDRIGVEQVWSDALRLLDGN